MVTRSMLFKVTGITEAMVQQRLSDLGGQGNPGLAYLAKPGEVHVRVTARDLKPEVAGEMVSELAAKVKERLVDFIFALDDEVLEEVVGRLLTEGGVKIAVAESCTGGLIATRLTNVPGSSGYFLGSIVAYDNQIKERFLGVSKDVLEKHGAVSKETAEAMARGIQNLLKPELGLGVTGIAGPGGGTETKPVGLVFIALATPGGTYCRQFRFPGERPGVRWGASNAGLNMIRLYLRDELC